MSFMKKGFPFAAVVGQEQVKKAILITLVTGKSGGLLISGTTGTAKTTLVRSAAELSGDRRIHDLPLNATEDMLFGSIDIEHAVQSGQRRFSPGLLGRADGELIYIDEANLLRTELLTAVLDIAMAGVNQVERDGISYSHRAEYTVIGTMNPEEGTLAGNLLDRFGMFVEAEKVEEKGQRMEIMRRLLAFNSDPEGFRAAYSEETETLRRKVAEARKLLPQVEISEAMILLSAQMASQAFCAGHRADLYILEVARAIAALAGRSYLLPKDMEEAAVFVLPHRMRKPPEPQPEESDEDNNNQEEQDDSEENSDDSPEDSDMDDDSDVDPDDLPEDDRPLPPPLPPEGSGDDDDTEDEDDRDDNDEEEPPEQEEPPQNNAPEDQVAGIDTGFMLPKIVLDMGRDRAVRRGSGKRSLTKTDLKQGRYVRAEIPKNKVEDLAFDATIRAAAPFQRHRADNGCAIKIHKEDLRQRVREKRIGTTFLFAVDASGSMGARERMKAVKGAIFAMLQEAYQKRDKVGMVAFRRDKAELLLPITRSVDLAQKCLAELPTGGKTPLADGLAEAFLALDALKKKEKDCNPILILVTDGRANSGTSKEKDPVEAAVKMAEQMNKAKITSVVIDTENDFIKLGIAKKVAKALGATYYSLQQLSQGEILRIVRNIGE